jgi:hypothetical protein
MGKRWLYGAGLTAVWLAVFTASAAWLGPWLYGITHHVQVVVPAPDRVRVVITRTASVPQRHSPAVDPPPPAAAVRPGRDSPEHGRRPHHRAAPTAIPRRASAPPPTSPVPTVDPPPTTVSPIPVPDNPATPTPNTAFTGP